MIYNDILYRKEPFLVSKKTPIPLLKEKGLGRECKFVLVSRLVECKPSANEGDPTGRFFI